MVLGLRPVARLFAQRRAVRCQHCVGSQHCRRTCPFRPLRRGEPVWCVTAPEVWRKRARTRALLSAEAGRPACRWLWLDRPPALHVGVRRSATLLCSVPTIQDTRPNRLFLCLSLLSVIVQGGLRLMRPDGATAHIQPIQAAARRVIGCISNPKNRFVQQSLVVVQGRNRRRGDTTCSSAVCGPGGWLHLHPH